MELVVEEDVEDLKKEVLKHHPSGCLFGGEVDFANAVGYSVADFARHVG